MSRKASLVKGALMTYLRPKLAQDARLDLDSLLVGINNDNYGQKKLKLAQDIETALWRKGMLTMGADVRELPQLLTALEEVEEPEDQVSKLSAEDATDDMMAWLAEKLSPNDLAEFKRLLSGEATDQSMTRPAPHARFTGAQDARFPTNPDTSGLFHRFPEIRRIGIV